MIKENPNKENPNKENPNKENPNNYYPKEKEEAYFSDYLNSLRNKTTGFKRVVVSPLRYAGGKSKAVGLILDQLPHLPKKRIVSPFFGGGSVELCLSQHLGIEVIGYDIFPMLTNFWDVLIHRKKELLDVLQTMEVNEDAFTKNRHILLSYWDKIKPPTLHYKTKKKVALTPEEQTLLDTDPVLQAAYYYYNMSLSYGPMFLGWPSSHEIDEKKFKRRLTKMEKQDFSVYGISVSCDDFKNVIARHTDDFLFLDPPYYLGQDSNMFKGMYPNCNFAIHHDGFDHKGLLALLKNHKGGFFLTYNNCPTIRDMYKDYIQTFPEWQYTYGQGETRIGKNRIEKKEEHVKESHEIFIVCPASQVS